MRYLCFCILALALSTQSITQTAQATTKKHALDGKASWYGDNFHGKKTASGTIYDMHTDTAAHRTLPFGTVVEVQDTTTPHTALVCITDRGPYIHGRVIDVSRTAAKQLTLMQRGVAPVHVRIVSDTQGKVLKDDEAFYVRLHNVHEAKVQHIGPYAFFADASAMRDALRTAHPEARICLAPTTTKTNNPHHTPHKNML